MENMKSTKTKIGRAQPLFVIALSAVLLAGCASLQQNMDASRKAHLVPGKEIHLTDMRGYTFCEVALITGTSKANAIADFYNSTGSSSPTWAQFDALDAKNIKKETDSRAVFLNPVRHWMFDEFWVYEDGIDRTFGDIKMTWMGVVPVEQLERGVTKGHYVPGYIYRDSQYQYNKGSEIYILDAPHGEVFVMQSFTDAVQKEVDINHIKDLGSKLQMPPGWKFRSVVLDRDLIVNQKRANNLAHVFQDDMKDAYQGSDGGKAFNFVP
jgi:hypothetical protein